jgi:hypothetical protein
VTIARARILVCHPATLGVRRTADAELAALSLGREFPSIHVRVEPDGGAASPLPTVDAAAWDDRTRDFAPFDEHVDDLACRGPATLVIRAPDGDCERIALEMLTRWQRLVDRRNDGSSTPEFDRLLTHCRELHDVSKPLVRADWNHALDTGLWMLRLDGEASAAAQMAALLHDVERLESEADRRVEHLAPSYELFKEGHARRGAEMTRAILGACDVDAATIDRVAHLVARHEASGDDPDRALLNDADALSFFSQNSAGYLDYFGPEQTRRKIAYTLGRMRGAARARLPTVRLRADVASAFEAVVAREAADGLGAPPDAHAPARRVSA